MNQFNWAKIKVLSILFILPFFFQNCGEYVSFETRTSGKAEIGNDASGETVSTNDDMIDIPGEEPVNINDIVVIPDPILIDDEDDQEESSNDDGEVAARPGNGNGNGNGNGRDRDDDDDDDDEQEVADNNDCCGSDDGEAQDEGEAPAETAQGDTHYICITEGPGNSRHVKFDSQHNLLYSDNSVPVSVCMSRNACESILTSTFNVQEAAERGYCKNGAPNQVSMKDAQISTILLNMQQASN